MDAWDKVRFKLFEQTYLLWNSLSAASGSYSGKNMFPHCVGSKNLINIGVCQILRFTVFLNYSFPDL